MKLTTDALIIRQNNNIGEADRFVTALTRECGVVQASVRGARNLKNKSASATQLLSHSRLSLYRGREKYIVDDAEPLNVFFAVRDDLEKVALAQYFCELALALAPRDEPAENELRLLLGGLHYLSQGTRPLSLIKAVVELKLLCLAGYTPALSGCAGCEGTPVAFSPVTGTVFCVTHAPQNAVAVSSGVLTALRHVVTAPVEKCFAFSLSDDGLTQLETVCEKFLLAQVDRGFKTLDFYHGSKTL